MVAVKLKEKIKGMRLKRGFDMLGFLVGTSVGRIILGLVVLAFGAFFVVFLKSILIQILANSGGNTTELISEYTQYINWTGTGFMIAGAGIVIKGLLDVFRGV